MANRTGGLPVVVVQFAKIKFFYRFVHYFLIFVCEY
jgi:hypothetical protein